MSATRLVLTGAAGFVGAWIARQALRQGMEVHGLVRPGGDTVRLRELDGQLAVHEADLRDAVRLRGLLRELAPEAVVHAAFPGGHPGTEGERRRMLEEGVGGAASLLEALRGTVARPRLVHVGSGSVYGPSPRPHGPDDPLRPASFRGACKAAASVLFRQFAAEEDLPVAEVRLFSVYGPWEQPHRLLPRLLRAALTGTTVAVAARAHPRNWIYAGDAAEACLAALRTPGPGFAVINAGTNELLAADAVAREVEAITGRRLAGGDYRAADAYGDPCPRCVLPAAGDGLAWSPRHGVGDGLRETWAWAQTAAGREFLAGC